MPNTNYKNKYAHLIGEDSALEAARKTETNKSYGFGKVFKGVLSLVFKTFKMLISRISLGSFFPLF